MATHDYVIANGTGSAVRSDLNNALAAIVSNNSSSSEPSTKYAYQWWADTTTGQLKLRNSANNAWVTIFELDGTMLMEDGTVSAPGLAFASDLNTGFFRSAADTLAIATAGTQRVTVDSSGRVGIGITNPDSYYQHGRNLVVGATGAHSGITIRSGSANQGMLAFAKGTSGGSEQYAGYVAYNHDSGSAEHMQFAVGATERLRIDSSGNFGIGTSTARAGLTVARGSNSIPAAGASTGSAVFSNATDNAIYGVVVGANTSGTGYIQSQRTDGTATTYSLAIQPNGGNVGIGKTNPNTTFEIYESTNPYIYLQNSTTGTGAGDGFSIVESGLDTYINNREAGNMLFYNNGSERMRIQNGGNVLIGQTNGSFGTVGTIFSAGGQSYHTVSGDTVLFLNRHTNDGEIVRIAQGDVTEGNISVSGSTVSYNGGHLARWSQLASGAARTEILRGSVLSNLDEMCEWGEEDNEQLNRMQVSDVEGDKNVSGVFQSWDDDDDTYVNDFYCAMTGDFVIRIAQGTTVARGDLLMSAGDGTAKPQDDDIVRSKTIAKVTSTTVSETYSDNSYCVPCVLMAC